MKEPNAAYRRDLAYIHNAGFGMIAENAAVELLGALRKRHPQGYVVDLGCGGGLLSAPLAEAGYDVVGYDLSPAMIELARARVPSGTFHVESFLDATLPPCVAIAAVGEIFCYLFDKRNAKRPLGPMLRKLYRALAPGGVLLFDVATPGRVPPDGTRGYREGDDWVCLHAAEEDSSRQRLIRRITSFCRDGESWRRDDEVHHLRLFDPRDVTAELGAAGFQVRRLHHYGEFKFPKGLVGFWAVKPKKSSSR